MNLKDIPDTLLDPRTKGIPFGTEPFALKEIGAKGWNVLQEDLPLPLMLLRRSALDHNAKVFAEYLAAHDLSFAPHGKTTMAPQIYAEQLRDGAWGITAATVGQVQVMHHYGVERVILANQLIGQAHLHAVAGMINARPDFELYVFVDSVAQLQNMARHLEGVALDRPLRMLVEVGVAGGRTGLRSTAEAVALGEALMAADPSKFRFAGVAAFEGVVPGQTVEAIRAYAQSVVDAARAMPGALLDGMDEFVISGGGSSHFDVMGEVFKTLTLPLPVRVVLRSGCYVTTDHGGYKAAQDAARDDPHRTWKSNLEPALEVWAYVQSRPEPDLAFLTMGKRDMPYDSHLPKPFRRYRPGTGFLPVGTAEVFASNDQHAFVRLGEGAADWQVGDMIASGIAHPCTAFDKWRMLPVVDDDMTVIDGVLTFF